MRYVTILKFISILAILTLSTHQSFAHKLDDNTITLKGHPNLEADITTLTQSEKEYLSNLKTIKIAITEKNFHPYDIIDNESHYYKGISADFLQLIKDSLKINIEIVRFKAREDAINAVKNGETDLLTTSNDYEEYNGLILSTPYLSDRPALFRNTNSTAKVKTISIAYDYLADNIVKEYFPENTIINYPTKKAAIAAAAFGKTDAVIMDSVSANYMINNTFYKRLQLESYLHINSKGIAFATTKINEPLLEIFNKAIKIISKDKNRLIRKRWSGGGYIIPERNELPAFNDNEISWISKNREINVVFNEYMAPLSYLDSTGHPSGYGIEILELLKLYSGLEINYIPSKNFNDQKELVLKSKLPYITILTPSNSRAKLFSFSSEFTSSPYVIVQRKNESNINEPIISVPNGHSIEEYTRQNLKFKEIITTSNFIEALDAVKNKEADYTIIPLNIADYYNNGYFDSSLEIKEVADNIPNAVANFAVKKDEHILINIINKTLLSIPPNELQVMEIYWRSNALPAKQTWKDYKYTIYTIVISSTIMILVSIIWAFYTHTHYRKRLTAKKELSQQLQFMQSIVDAIPHPIYVRNKQRELTMCNESYLNAFNASREDVLHKTTVEGTCYSKEAPIVDKEYVQALEDGIAVFKDRELHINGNKYNIYHWLKSYGDELGNIEGIIGGWIDVSDRVKLIEELEHAKEVADSASHAKSTFLATMSHEIRTPMNAIIGMLELALKRTNTQQFDLNSIKVAYDSANDLLELIGDILDIARIEAGQLSLSPIRTNLKTIATSVVRVFDGLARQKGITLQLDFDPVIANDVLIDPMRIKQILSNLIGNAIKFTDKGGVNVKIQSENVTNSTHTILFTVKDTGIGISRDDQQKLFTPFSQVQGTHATHGGTGLGLMICRTLCEMMGGSLTLESKLHQGTQISMQLTLTQLEAELTHNFPLPLPESHESNPSDILIVDDHSANRLLLAQQLKYLGHSVDEAENGLIALNMFESKQYPVVITDCNMPEMNGYELCQKIRQLEHKRHMHAIVIGYTANAQKEAKDACLAAGMNDCLFKPISLMELESIINQFISEKITKTTTYFAADAVEKLTGNNAELVDKLLKELLKSNQSDLQSLYVALENNDLSTIKDLAHKIKGAARIIDAQKLMSACEMLENASHQQLNAYIEAVSQAIILLEADVISYTQTVSK